MKGHSIEKVYICGLCNEKFSDLLSLEEHELEHDLSAVTPLIDVKPGHGEVIQLAEEIIDSAELIVNSD